MSISLTVPLTTTLEPDGRLAAKVATGPGTLHVTELNSVPRSFSLPPLVSLSLPLMAMTLPLYLSVAATEFRK